MGEARQVRHAALAPARRPRPEPGGAAPTVNGHGIDPTNEWGHDALWWLDRMVRSQRPLAEKMTFFWHDHFAASGQQTPLMLRPGRIRFHVTNFGQDAHNLQVAGPHGYRSPVTADIRAGQHLILSVTLRRPGVYRLICTKPGHVKPGMRASIRVKR